MTLQDYAKYLLNVCGRRFTNLYRRHYLESTNALPSLSALLSYLRTQTASIFTQIKARGSVHPLSGLPSTETLATLPTALATLNSRKVDVGTSTQIDDGVSLYALLGCSTEKAKVTEIVDTNKGWTWTALTINDLINLFPNLTKVTIGAGIITSFTRLLQGTTNITHISLPYATEVTKVGESTYSLIPWITGAELLSVSMPNVVKAQSGNQCGLIANCPKLTSVNFSNLEELVNSWSSGLIDNCELIEEVLLPKLVRHTSTGTSAYSNMLIRNCANLEKVVLGKLIFSNNYGGSQSFLNCPKLIHLESLGITDSNQDLSVWSPTLDATNLATFLSNFRQYIALRLQSRAGIAALTLTLSSTVYSAIQTADSMQQGQSIYQYLTSSAMNWRVEQA